MKLFKMELRSRFGMKITTNCSKFIGLFFSRSNCMHRVYTKSVSILLSNNLISCRLPLASFKNKNTIIIHTIGSQLLCTMGLPHFTLVQSVATIQRRKFYSIIIQATDTNKKHCFHIQFKPKFMSRERALYISSLRTISFCLLFKQSTYFPP